MRQNYNRGHRGGPHRWARRAQQFKRTRKAVRTLHSRVAWVHREVQRHRHVLPQAAKAKVQALRHSTVRFSGETLHTFLANAA